MLIDALKSFNLTVQEQKSYGVFGG
jgi:hypothetical protein